MMNTQSNLKADHAKQAELEAVLASETFRRAPTLARILEYLCDRQLRGETFIKEYEIATQVMGRGSDFDPQQDGSVRVNLHHLRKKLKGFYETEGAGHVLWISLPIGQSLPSFVAQSLFSPTNEPAHATAQQELSIEGAQRVQQEVNPAADPSLALPLNNESAAEMAVSATPALRPAAAVSATQRSFRFSAILLACVCAAALLASVLTWLLLSNPTPHNPSAVISDATLRLACGAHHPFQDSAGRTWGADAWFHGGSSFHRALTIIDGASDSRLYQSGREGDFSYDIPLPRASYELHLYFAETGVHGEGFRTLQIWINGHRMEQMFDVTSDAGGFASATERIYTLVEPAADGKLHLQFKGVTSSAFVNAIEMMPGNGDAMRPIRQTTLPTYYFDPQGTVWTPDAWFHGGRTNSVSALFPALSLPGFYQNERFGNFSYSIPVPANRTYSLTLYFQDAWFSHQTNRPVNPGQRRFDVTCNGQVLLRQFNIIQEAGRDAAQSSGENSYRVTRRFTGIQPTTAGKIMLSFTPSENYAVLSAFTIEQEPQPATAPSATALRTHR